MDFILSPIKNHATVVITAFGDALNLLTFKGRESLSELFSFELELVSKNANIDTRALLGTNLTVEQEAVGALRYFNGVVTRFNYAGRQQATSEYYLYKVTVRPSLWYLTQGQDYRIFQEQTVPDILKTVLGRYDFAVDYRLNGSYRNWEYCVQYEESDFNFISRLMEHEGMYYWFEHVAGQHTLVISDDRNVHQPYGAYDRLLYLDAQTNLSADKEHVLSWYRKAGMTTVQYSTIDYDFRKPNVKLDTSQSQRVAGDRDGSEHYEWQAGYQELDHAETYARVRLEEEKVTQEVVRGTTTARGLCPGYTFNLINHPIHTENQQYLCIEAIYDISIDGYSTGTERKDHFEIHFKAIPASIQFRAPRRTPKPKTSGPQTARVVGAAGEEIWTDKYGRVKVQFHWDREGRYDENSSCWVRVSSPWAGGGFGGIQLPRINDEVVVDFIGGDPDRPIILGRVYNEMNMPPVNLPEEANISGFRTQSIYGDNSTKNHLLFIDELGKEIVDLRAEHDMLVTVFNDLYIKAGNNLSTSVGATEQRNVAQTRTTTVGGVETETFKVGQKTEIGSGGRDTTITGPVIDVIKGAVDYKQKGGSFTVKSTGNRTFTLDGSDTFYTKGISNWTFSKNLTETVKKQWKPTTKSLMLWEIGGKATEVIKQNYETTVKGSLRSMSVESGSYDLTANSNITYLTTASNGSFTASGNKATFEGGAKALINSPTKIDFNYGTSCTVRALQINRSREVNMRDKLKFEAIGINAAYYGYELKSHILAATFYGRKKEFWLAKADEMLIATEAGDIEKLVHKADLRIAIFYIQR
ncbi:MAG: type VI secretion system tip protein TssI/VgrG [Alcaligenaceae bacterium]|nr:type VI secretion system tip protein TssI/VgrG [Alcaligenaceae bacterium]